MSDAVAAFVAFLVILVIIGSCAPADEPLTPAERDSKTMCEAGRDLGAEVDC